MSEVLEYEVSNNCRCTQFDYENDCEVLDDKGNPVPSDWCNGCWQDDMSNIDYDMLVPWIQANGIEETDCLYIGGDGIGWQRRSGWTISAPTIDDIVDKLSLNGDFTLYFKYDGKDLTVRRSSHDEPTGTGVMVIRIATEDEVEEWRNR
ncbi:MAG: hypothetical protein EBR82_26650 [Caulobacteraceae bacterium]|nr:hypothetical protein [Caulobacteraceae bacterium]